MKTYKKDLRIYEIQISTSEKENLEKAEKLIFKILKDSGSMVIISLVD
jgi:predicted class III extradiol MEMO1 family dioxygenase